MGQLIGIGVLALIAIAGVFMVAREFVLWYWRIDEGIELLRSIDFSLQQLPVVREAKIAQAARKSRAT